MRKPALALSALAVVLAVMLPVPASASAGPAQAAQCPPGQVAATCVKGTMTVWEDPAVPSLNQFIVADNSGAPQFSVGVGGAASYANPLCVTNNPLTHPPLRFLACIGGPWGSGQGAPMVTLFDAKGRAFTLTIRDIRCLHALERGGIRALARCAS